MPVAVAGLPDAPVVPGTPGYKEAALEGPAYPTMPKVDRSDPHPSPSPSPIAPALHLTLTLALTLARTLTLPLALTLGRHRGGHRVVLTRLEQVRLR